MLHPADAECEVLQHRSDIGVSHLVDDECEVLRHCLNVGVLCIVDAECEVLRHRLDVGVLHPIDIEPGKLAKKGRECRRAVRERSQKVYEGNIFHTESKHFRRRPMKRIVHLQQP
jgi:hypothetical protein